MDGWFTPCRQWVAWKEVQKMKVMTERESNVERFLKKEIEILGGRAEKFSSPSNRGVPDLLVSWPAYHRGLHSHPVPQVEFIEVKTIEGRLTKLQEKDHERRRSMGFEVTVVYGMEQARNYLVRKGWSQ